MVRWKKAQRHLGETEINQFWYIKWSDKSSYDLVFGAMPEYRGLYNVSKTLMSS